ncbi:hypothetical protein [Streptomyces solaniscabiei]|uniref:hypothetical protein n=1 Tax=Streptomyces solaniscabiei TaxID=2683255 RepID=UPI003557E41C
MPGRLQAAGFAFAHPEWRNAATSLVRRARLDRRHRAGPAHRAATLRRPQEQGLRRRRIRRCPRAGSRRARCAGRTRGSCGA